ncbi:hypothetical protein GW17_00030125 [Ensete ventricosum]|nr:hypothetical protein GW17_00030125 [Ensete ventricosum]RZR97717.1 hypothetical protein BHM03_00027002 [Ensete ventricosum]
MDKTSCYECKKPMRSKDEENNQEVENLTLMAIDNEKELQIRHEPRIKLRHQVKDWTMRWELARSSLEDSLKGSGSSIGTHWEIAGGRP